MAAKRILREQVDVVGDNHYVANLELLVHASGSVADKEGLHTDGFHDANRECNLLHVVAFIVVETARHSYYFASAQTTEDKFAVVASNR